MWDILQFSLVSIMFVLILFSLLFFLNILSYIFFFKPGLTV